MLITVESFAWHPPLPPQDNGSVSLCAKKTLQISFNKQGSVKIYPQQFPKSIFVKTVWDSKFQPAFNMQNDNAGEDPRNHSNKTLQIPFPGSELQEV